MNIYYVAGIPYSDELYHHGILGQKWGIRRYQNPDGTLTPAGRQRYGRDISERSDWKLKNQNARLMTNNPKHYAEEKRVMRRFLDKARASKSREEVRKLGESFIKELAATRLQSMGYEANSKNISILAGKEWFRNSTLLSNTLAWYGVSDVNNTSRDDYRYGPRIQV